MKTLSLLSLDDLKLKGDRPFELSSANLNDLVFVCVVESAISPELYLLEPKEVQASFLDRNF
jgi:hypothetical protein